MRAGIIIYPAACLYSQCSEILAIIVPRHGVHSTSSFAYSVFSDHFGKPMDRRPVPLSVSHAWITLYSDLCFFRLAAF